MAVDDGKEAEVPEKVNVLWPKWSTSKKVNRLRSSKTTGKLNVCDS